MDVRPAAGHIAVNMSHLFFQKGYTALHLASKKGKKNIVNLLGSLGADCNIENEVLIKNNII